MTSIRIATLNLWNSDNTDHLQLERLHAAEELVRLDADVVALQEVRSHLADDHNHSSDAATFLQGRTAYGFLAFRSYPGEPGEGLAFLSRHPLRVAGAGSGTIDDCVLRVTVDIDGIGLALTNVHLDWRRVATRERQIVEVMGVIARESEGDRYEVLLGDSNSCPESSVYQFLAGQQTLHGKDTQPWHDLARTWAEQALSAPAAALDSGAIRAGGAHRSSTAHRGSTGSFSRTRSRWRRSPGSFRAITLACSPTSLFRLIRSQPADGRQDEQDGYPK